jgi:transcriptional regulator with XRE-family HTH domain
MYGRRQGWCPDSVADVPAAKSPDHLAFGKALRKLRTERDISQEELGYRSGLHRNYVGAIERGEINLSLTIMLQLANGLNTTLTQLIHHYDEELRETSKRLIDARSGRQ